MRNSKDILVTTTSTVEGLSIKRYIKPISAHVVAGTNFFSDFFASFSDVFGGRSQTYQKQLSSIYNESIETLKQTANEIGANCILGLKVDLDEVSGKGKSMFMITATGTAVIVEDLNKNINGPNEKLEAISFEKMVVLRKKEQIIQLAIDNKLNLNDSMWEFLIQNNVFEISREVLLKAHEAYKYVENTQKFYQLLLSYFTNVPEENRTKLLYDSFVNDNSSDFSKIIFQLINDLMIFDSSKLQAYLINENIKIRQKALQIVVIDKSFYTKEDVKIYENFINTISTNYSKTGELSSQKKNILSSKEKEIWICQCGIKNEIEVKQCISCLKDIYGYTSGQVNPEAAIKKLQENIELIKSNIA